MIFLYFSSKTPTSCKSLNSKSLLEPSSQDNAGMFKLSKYVLTEILDPVLLSYDGIGTLTVVKLLAETDGFRNVKSIRSLVSYSGLDVAQNQSGKMKGKSRISKKGNAYIRAALYMPAMSAVRHDEKSKIFYERLNKKLPKKKQSLIAIMRKLLIIIYTLWNNGEDYNVNHEWQKKRGLSPVTG